MYSDGVADECVFGERTRLLRVSRGLTQRQLAEKIGVGRTTVGMYESGLREPSCEIAQRLAAVLSTTVDYLLGSSDDPRAGATPQGQEEACPLIMEILEHLEKLTLEEQQEVLRYVRFLLAGREDPPAPRQ
jgi:transcriptional regulator with XRE-family HTH domain